MNDEVTPQRKRYIKGTDEQAGGIFDVESAVPYSNLQLVDPETKWLCGSLVI